MDIFKFRVVVDHERDVFRDIEIEISQTFEDFHRAIIAAFSFNGDQMASFYMSNENWEQGQEIGLMDMSFGEEDGPPTMTTAVLKDFVIEKEQKVLYIYDFLKMWVFYIELIEVKKRESEQQYPCLALSFGDAPNEDEKDIEGHFSEAETTQKEPQSKASEIDDILNEYNDEMTSEEGFENIDDYDL